MSSKVIYNGLHFDGMVDVIGFSGWAIKKLELTLLESILDFWI